MKHEASIRGNKDGVFNKVQGIKAALQQWIWEFKVGVVTQLRSHGLGSKT